MRFVVAFAIALFLAFACSSALRRTPWVFYLLCLGADALCAYGMMRGSVTGFWGAYVPFMQRCTLAMALFTIVMFVGVFRDDSAIRRRLLPVRQQLSICGCLLCINHIWYYASTYIVQFQSGSLRQIATSSANLPFSLALSALLVALLLVLGITSFTFVKTRMKASTWKKIQRLSYVFFTLIVVHLGIILVPPALSGNTPAIESVAVWGTLFVIYAVLKIRREVALKHE